MPIESKVKVVKAVLLPMLRQIIGVVWQDVQEEASLYVVWAASIPDIVQGIVIEVDVEVCSEYRLACYDRLIRLSTIVIVDIDNRLALPEFVFSGRYPLPGFDIDDGVVWERDRCKAFSIESDTMIIRRQSQG